MKKPVYELIREAPAEDVLAGYKIHLPIGAEGDAEQQRVPVHAVVGKDETGALDQYGLRGEVEFPPQPAGEQPAKQAPDFFVTRPVFHFALLRHN